MERCKDEAGSDAADSAGSLITLSATSSFQAVQCFCTIMKHFVQNFCIVILI